MSKNAFKSILVDRIYNSKLILLVLIINLLFPVILGTPNFFDFSCSFITSIYMMAIIIFKEIFISKRSATYKIIFAMATGVFVALDEPFLSSYIFYIFHRTIVAVIYAYMITEIIQWISYSKGYIEYCNEKNIFV